MRTLVHLSDLHFGRIDQRLLAPLQALVREVAPDVLVVSGDLTQRATSAQFSQARAFLDALPQPQVVVPGNHDIPLYDVMRRFLRPLARYRRHITADLEPAYIDDEIAVLGLNTARSLTIKDGRINREQIARLTARLAQLPSGLTRIVVTHHPFDLPQLNRPRDLVLRAPQAMAAFASAGVDLLLSGHMHASYAGTTASRYPRLPHAALAIQAGTATSTRGRGEANAFNVVRIEGPAVRVVRYGWDEERHAFAPVAQEMFTRSNGQWQGSA